MVAVIKKLLAAHGITAVAPLALADCRITRGYLLTRAGIEAGTAVLFAVPYYTTECDSMTRNISAYAVGADYHVFFCELFEDILPRLAEKFPAHRFAGFTDHSPIDERDAAVRAGLGVIGKNHLLLTKEHASFVFLGEIITDAVLETAPRTPVSCIACGACLAACPVGLDAGRCLSALTQKKGTFTEKEADTVRKNGYLWGCDRCQEACPVTRAAKEAGTLYSDVEFFQRTALPHLDRTALNSMSEEDFRTRAYSWRGKETILRNIALFEEEAP